MRTPVRVLRTGRFRLQLEGRQLTVYDGGGEGSSIRAKLSEWLELAEAIRDLRPRPSTSGTTRSKP